MSRPKPKIIMSSPRPWTTIEDDELQVCAADQLYVVCYRGEPIMIRQGPAENRYPGYKYKRSAWPNPGHAHNQAQQLNEMFGTTDFGVWIMRPHREIKEPKPTPRRYNPDWQPPALDAAGIVPKPGDKVKPF